MTPASEPRILLTGATGFIGGTILDYLLKSASLSLRTGKITCLLRGGERAAVLSSAYGDRVRPITYQDLDDINTTTAVAAKHDIVISTTLGFHPESAQALLRGLAQRRASTGRDVWMIHLSGTSNLSDQPVSGRYVEEVPQREFDDRNDDIYGYERWREKLHPYPQRTTELGVVDNGIKMGVKTLVMMPPLIFGIGTGLFNNISVQIPTYIRSALGHGRAVVLGDGIGEADHVHVEDLAELYSMVLMDILENDGKNLPSGQKGIIFSGNGRHSWMEVAQETAEACFAEGKIEDTQVDKVSIVNGAKILRLFNQVDEELVEISLSSNCRTQATVARNLGWKPTRGGESWTKGFRDDLKVVLEKS